MPKSRGRNGRRMKTRQRQSINRRRKAEGRKMEEGQVVVGRDFGTAYITQKDGSVRRMDTLEAEPYVNAAKRNTQLAEERAVRDRAVLEAVVESLKPLPPKPPSGLVTPQGQPVEGVVPGKILGPDGEAL